MLLSSDCAQPFHWHNMKLGRACPTAGCHLWRHLLCHMVYKNQFQNTSEWQYFITIFFFCCNEIRVAFPVFWKLRFTTREGKKSINRALQFLMQYTGIQHFCYFMKCCSFSKLFHNRFLQRFWHHILTLTEFKCYLLLKSKYLFWDFHPWIRWSLLCREQSQITI